MRSDDASLPPRLAAACLSSTEARAADGFDIVGLGALGGIQDGNLSA